MMINPHKGDVSFDVAGKSYMLRYSHSALIALENKLDKSLMSVIAEMSDADKLRIGTVVAILWAGLQKHHPKMTYDDAAALLDDVDGGVSTMIEVIGNSFQKAFNAPGTKGTNPPQKETNGTGTISSLDMSPLDMIPRNSGTSRLES